MSMIGPSPNTVSDGGRRLPCGRRAAIRVRDIRTCDNGRPLPRHQHRPGRLPWQAPQSGARLSRRFEEWDASEVSLHDEMCDGRRKGGPDHQQQDSPPSPRRVKARELDEEVRDVHRTVRDVGEYREDEQSEEEIEGELLSRY